LLSINIAAQGENSSLQEIYLELTEVV